MPALTRPHRVAALAAFGFGAALAAAAPAWADTGDTADAVRHQTVARRATAAPAVNRTTAAARAKGARTHAPVKTAVSPLANPSVQAGAPTLTLRSSEQSPFTLSSGSTAAAQLSGITYAGDTSYYAVGDNGAASIWQVYTSLNGTNGLIRSSAVSGGISAPDLGRDSEGIAFHTGADSVWVSDEIDSTITEFSLSTGQKIGTVTVPTIFRPANVQNNMGLESLTYGAGTLWTANEEALKPDGALSTTEAGSWVRVQKFTGPDTFTAGAQYAYRTDPISELSPFIDVERSGMVDMLALPDGRVLTLERELGGVVPYFRSRVYLLDFTGATDVSALDTLTAGGFTPLTKTLLWQGVFGLSNFEGMALGPKFSDGGYGVLLVSDDGSGQLGQRQTILSLVLGGVTAV